MVNIQKAGQNAAQKPVVAPAQAGQVGSQAEVKKATVVANADQVGLEALKDAPETQNVASQVKEVVAQKSSTKLDLAAMAAEDPTK